MNIETPVVIDMECFRSRNRQWIVKEIAVYGDYLDSVILQKPYPFQTLPCNIQKSYSWLTNNPHGLCWNAGNYPYDRLPSFIESIKLRYPKSLFYAKGIEKGKFLSDLFDRDFYDLEDLGCPRIDQLKTSNIYCCNSSLFHSSGTHCARKKAKAFGSWLQNYILENDELEDSVIKGLHDLCLKV